MNKVYRHFLMVAVVALSFFSSAQAQAEPDFVSFIGPTKPWPTHAISVFGDIKYPANFKHFDYVNPNAPKGGRIVMPAIGNFNNLNPYILKGEAASGIGLTFDTLMTQALDETGTNYGLVAKSASVAADDSYIVFHLNRAARFADGSPVTADDVVWTFKTLTTKGHPIYKIYFAEIESAQKLSKYQVKFVFKNPENRELKFILGQLPVLSKAYYDKVDFEKTTIVPPLGSGPYRVKSVEPGRAITYELRDDYWAKDLPVNKGMYNFRDIKYEYYKDSNVAIQAFKSGKLDLRYENVAKNWATAYNIPAVADGRIKKVKIPHEIPTGMQAFVLNHRREKFTDPLVRKAISLTMDFEWMNNNLFYGSYTRTQSYFSNSIYAAAGLPSKAELKLLEKFKDQLPPEVFTQEFKLPVSDGNGRIRERLLEAMRLLEKAGYKVENGKLMKNGKQLKVEFLVENGSSLDRLLPAMFENLQQLGIKAIEKSVDASQYKTRTEVFDYDIIVNSWGQGNSPGNEQVSYWSSSTADVKGSQNYIGLKNPVVDFLVDKIVKTKNKQDLITATHALDRVLLWNYYVIPHFYAGYFRILYWDKYAMPKTLPLYDANFGLYTWWAKQEKK